ncbi:hypothetical protein, partial [Nocardia brasiliensis]
PPAGRWRRDVCGAQQFDPRRAIRASSSSTDPAAVKPETTAKVIPLRIFGPFDEASNAGDDHRKRPGH